MKDYVKSIIYQFFQYLIVISIPFVMCFYWPNHDERLMKFLCFQTYVMILLALSFLFNPKRSIDNFYPALFLIVGFINLFTHGMSDFVNVGLSFITFSVIGIYVISNHVHTDYVLVIKKTIVITCLINCALFILQQLPYYHLSNIQLVFNLDQGYERPSGFMCYPASFSLLCAISLFLTWDWKKWLCVPIGACLILSHEYSVIGGLILAIFMTFSTKWWHYTLILVVLGLIGHHFWPQINGKIMLRMKFLYPVIQNIWARPLDGWGVGMYNRLPDSFFGFPRGNWSEMHCEPLDLLFCMGISGVAVISGWLRNVENMNIMYKRIFIVYGVTSCFHSPFHFGDTLFLFIILYALMEIERHEQPATN